MHAERDIVLPILSVRLSVCRPVKVKVHTLDIARLRSESTPQKRSVQVLCLNEWKYVHSY